MISKKNFLVTILINVHQNFYINLERNQFKADRFVNFVFLKQRLILNSGLLFFSRFYHKTDIQTEENIFLTPFARPSL